MNYQKQRMRDFMKFSFPERVIDFEMSGNSNYNRLNFTLSPEFQMILPKVMERITITNFTFEKSDLEFLHNKAS